MQEFEQNVEPRLIFPGFGIETIKPAFEVSVCAYRPLNTDQLSGEGDRAYTLYPRIPDILTQMKHK